jgi:lipoprotein-releasing system permease protein
VGRFKVSGVVDLGMYDYDVRYVLTSAEAVQQVGGLGNRFSGIRIRINDIEKTKEVSLRLATEMVKRGYIVRDWTESRSNLFKAVDYEKIIIFIIILFITVVACFNIASSLFITVLRRFGDIGILKAMGMSERKIVRLFSFQGLILGALGTFLGVLLGLFLCWLVLHTKLIDVPTEIYHIDHLPIQVQFFDLFSIVFVAMILCWISTLWPAWRGAKQLVVEGLKYDER